MAEWISRICDQCLAALRKINSNFKYIVNCIISEKSAFEIQNSCFYSPFDANCLVKWENAEVSVIVNLFALAL